MRWLPKVSVVTLTNGSRPSMLERAVACFKASTYPNAEHVVFDASPYAGRTIGYIRNIVNACATGELIAHADDDDTFHARRLEEQVTMLQTSGKACVGYRELLFWDTRPVGWPKGCGDHAPADEALVSRPEAWLYRHSNPTMVVGASMMYRREAWEACKFSETEPHEDYHWWLHNASKCLGVPGFGLAERDNDGALVSGPVPRMICGIHGGNTSGAYARDKMRPPEWQRAPERDEYAAGVMKL